MPATEDKFYRARIAHRHDLAADLWVVRIDPGGEFRFAPGQYCTLGVQTPAKHVERAYSIVSAPFEKEVEIFIELVPAGELTPLLYKLQVGDELTMRKISKGRFTLDTKSGRTNHLLLATVTGIAPFVSYARSLYKEWKEGTFKGEHHLYLIDGASRSWEYGYHEEMEKYAREAPWFDYVATVSRPWEDPKWQGETGRIEDVMRKYADQWGLNAQNTSAYLCGHPQMIENGKGILKRHGFPKESMKEEVYWIAAKDAAE